MSGAHQGAPGAQEGATKSHEGRRFLLIASKAAGYGPEALEEMGRWLDAQPHPGRPIPKDRVSLVLNADGIRLHAPGQPALKWHPGTAYLRLRDGDDLVGAALPIAGTCRVL